MLTDVDEYEAPAPTTYERWYCVACGRFKLLRHVTIAGNKYCSEACCVAREGRAG
jgi:hypothetical protein